MTTPTAPVLHGERVLLSTQGSTAVLRFFNPTQGYMDEQMEAELMQALELLARWPEGRVVVLTGRDPGMFIRHYDVGVLAQRAEAMRAKGKHFTLERPVPQGGIHRCIALIDQSPLVFIAAINGVAMGGGFELALGCDLRVVQAGDHALGLPELNLGLLPGAGGTQAYARLLGTGKALELLLTAQVLQPAQMVALGLAMACVDDALAYALTLAARIEAVPARACAHIKQLVRRAPHWSPDTGLAAERTLFCDCMVDPAAAPLMQAVADGTRTIADAPART